jgi:hypothetical protein
LYLKNLGWTREDEQTEKERAYDWQKTTYESPTDRAYKEALTAQALRAANQPYSAGEVRAEAAA